MNRRLFAWSLSLLFLAAARPSHAADGLAYVATQHDGASGVNGLRSAEALALSPDGGQLYAAGSGDSALAVFSRDAATGALTFVEEDKQGTAGIEGLGAGLAYWLPGLTRVTTSILLDYDSLKREGVTPAVPNTTNYAVHMLINF